MCASKRWIRAERKRERDRTISGYCKGEVDLINLVKFTYAFSDDSEHIFFNPVSV
jgi:hypothetical protein